MGRQLFFAEHVEFLKNKNTWGTSYNALTGLFNDRFGTDFTRKQIWRVCAYRNLLLGHPLPDAVLEPGTERIGGNGYVIVKIASPDVWTYKHHQVWESANGPIPPGHVLIFGDKNRRNFDPDNLLLASKQEFGVMMGKGLIQGHADLTRSGLLIARLYIAMRKRFFDDPELKEQRYQAWLRKSRKKLQKSEGGQDTIAITAPNRASCGIATRKRRA